MASELICWKLTGNIIIDENRLKTMIDLNLTGKRVKQTSCVSGDVKRRHTTLPISSSCRQITRNLIKSVILLPLSKKMEGAGTWKIDITGMQSTKSECRHLSRPKWQRLPQIDCKEKGVPIDLKAQETPSCRRWALIQIYQLWKQANKTWSDTQGNVNTDNIFDDIKELLLIS